MKEAAAAVEAYVPSNNRSQLTRTVSNTLIVDAYNANPSSMTVALNNLSSVVSDKKVALLGDMLELGDDSEMLHAEIADLAFGAGLALVCFVGGEFGKVWNSMQDKKGSLWFETSEELKAWIEANPLHDAVVLVKGSRGTRMEKVLPVL